MASNTARVKPSARVAVTVIPMTEDEFVCEHILVEALTRFELVLIKVASVLILGVSSFELSNIKDPSVLSTLRICENVYHHDTPFLHFFSDFHA